MMCLLEGQLTLDKDLAFKLSQYCVSGLNLLDSTQLVDDSYTTACPRAPPPFSQDSNLMGRFFVRVL